MNPRGRRAGDTFVGSGVAETVSLVRDDFPRSGQPGFPRCACLLQGTRPYGPAENGRLSRVRTKALRVLGELTIEGIAICGGGGSNALGLLQSWGNFVPSMRVYTDVSAHKSIAGFGGVDNRGYRDLRVAVVQTRWDFHLREILFRRCESTRMFLRQLWTSPPTGGNG